MIITLSGVTGVGKSYFKDRIVEELNFKKIVIATTRQRRDEEIANSDKYFITDEELELLKKQNKVAYDFEYLGNRYAYLKEELLSKEDKVVEVHYSEIKKLKAICPQIYSIYLKPKDLEQAKDALIRRKLKQEEERLRLEEIEEQYKIFNENMEIQKQFDCILENCYDLQSDTKIITTIMNEKEKRSEQVF